MSSDGRIRVGFVMHKMQVAGAEVLVQQIIARLQSTIEPTVLCLDGLGEIGQQLRDDGVPVVVLDRQSGFDRGLARRLAREVTERQIQLLHAHQYTPFFYAALARLRYRLACRILFTEHGRHYPDIVSTKRRLVNRLLLSRYADATTACCDFSADALRRIEGFAKAFTLRNGVDLQHLPDRGDSGEQRSLRASLGMDPERPYAACIARFHPVKDHRTLIKAWERVHQQLPAARLLLVGDGPEREAMQQLSRELGLENSVEFWGIRSDVPAILRAADVFTLTSVSEAASLTLLEAMASGCTPVVTDVGGNAEHVRDGKEGFLVPRGGVEQLGERLTELLSSESLRHALGTAARNRVLHDFDLEKVIQHYKALYQQLIEGRRPESIST